MSSSTANCEPPTNREALMRKMSLLAALLLALPLLAQTDAQLFEQGKATMQTNDADKAIAAFEKAVAKNPKKAEYHYWLGNAYGLAARKANMFSQMSLGKKVGAEFNQAVALDPNYLDARMGVLEFDLQAPGIMDGGARRSGLHAGMVPHRPGGRPLRPEPPPRRGGHEEVPRLQAEGERAGRLRRELQHGNDPGEGRPQRRGPRQLPGGAQDGADVEDGGGGAEAGGRVSQRSASRSHIRSP